MTIYDLKPRFQALLRPLSNGLVRAGFTPNQVTVAALMLSLAQGLYLASYQHSALALVMLPVVLFVRMALNAIDGMMAKEHDMKTDLGKSLNEYGDIVSDLALYAPFAFVLESQLAMIFFPFFAMGIIMSEVVGIVGELLCGVRRYDGPMGKSDRAFAMGLLSVGLALVGEDGLRLFRIDVPGIYVLALTFLVWITAVNRYRKTFN